MPFYRWESVQLQNTLKVRGKLPYSQMTNGFVRFHPSPSPRDGPRNERCASEDDLFPKWLGSLTNPVTWPSQTGLLRKLNCDFPCFLTIWNLTVDLLIYFPYGTFVWALWTVDFIFFQAGLFRGLTNWQWFSVSTCQGFAILRELNTLWNHPAFSPLWLFKNSKWCSYI